MSFTPPSTAEIAMNWASKRLRHQARQRRLADARRAPQDHRVQPARLERDAAAACPAPSRCCWPITSSSVRGRRRSASGASASGTARRCAAAACADRRRTGWRSCCRSIVAARRPRSLLRHVDAARAARSGSAPAPAPRWSPAARTAAASAGRSRRRSRPRRGPCRESRRAPTGTRRPSPSAWPATQSRPSFARQRPRGRNPSRASRRPAAPPASRRAPVEACATLAWFRSAS